MVLRQRVMSQVVRGKNQIRAVLRENDIAGAKWLWSKRQLAWLESLELHPVAKLRLELAVEAFRSLSAKIKQLEAELQRYAITSTPGTARERSASSWAMCCLKVT